LWYFKNKVLNKLNPPLNNTTTCKKVSYRVNGGTKGLKHRNSLFEYPVGFFTKNLLWICGEWFE
jgi:hypothetical protein